MFTINNDIIYGILHLSSQNPQTHGPNFSESDGRAYGAGATVDDRLYVIGGRVVEKEPKFPVISFMYIYRF